MISAVLPLSEGREDLNRVANIDLWKGIADSPLNAGLGDTDEGVGRALLADGARHR